MNCRCKSSKQYGFFCPSSRTGPIPGQCGFVTVPVFGQANFMEGIMKKNIEHFQEYKTNVFCCGYLAITSQIKLIYGDTNKFSYHYPHKIHQL